ncbi:hypothetical protein [Streptomyces zaomyceticus]|uniref:hypothetical protein n=1 Tax=Streptomyces zaomyceticus TaxID=68286 RepID=UPI002E214A85
MLLPHAALLIDRARTALRFQPPSRHLAGWSLLVDDLEAASEKARASLTRPTSYTAPHDDLVLRHCRETWAERAKFLGDLAIQDGPPPPGPELPADEEARWTAHAQDVRRRHMMYLFETRYDAAGRPLTVVGVPNLDDPIDDCALVITGDIDSPTVRVIGRYDTYDQALTALPPPVQPGVLHPAGRLPGPDSPLPTLAELITDVTEAHASAVVFESLNYVASAGTGPCHLSQLSDLLSQCASFALATETLAGRDLSERLRALAVQTDHLDGELRQAMVAFEEDCITVLPPHRTPQPRHIKPPPAVRTTPLPAAQATPPRIPRRL